MRAILFIAAFALAVSESATAAQESITGPARVIDGDTIEIRGLNIRLQGIDAPERLQSCLDEQGRQYRCGCAATEALKNAIGYSPARCDLAVQRERYGRALGTCFVGGRNLNRWLVRQGYALVYRRNSMRYIADEEAARRRKVGMHAGRYVAPWHWRRGKRLK
ncbi:MAG: thermonuclease family protein [Rhodospirillaceae bacterium]|nr:thermonuclease family protein [Rhodospirillaceae bacterium]